MTVLSNATPGSEFMRSKDINFRPLGAETAPDGTMFFIDMHRGIIQQGNWTRKGSYLRGIIDKWEIDKNAGKGRIYRLVHKDHKPGPQPNMLGQSTKELVGHLSHPNGWWRDTAQKLIILRKDGKSVVPELEKLARSGKSALGRVHALWTLEGMDAVDPKLIVEKLSDSDHRVRLAAVRVSEPFLSDGDNALESAFKTLEKEPHADAALQAINSIAYSGATESEVLAGIQDNLIEKHSDKPILKSIAGNRAKLAQERERLAKQRKTDAHFAKQMESGAVIYKQLCFACHGNDGKGTPMVGQPGVTLAPPLPKSPRVLGSGGSLVRTVLHGLQGPLDGKTYPGQMLPLGANDDEWVAAISTYVRNSFGNKGGPITKEFVAGIRNESGDRLLPWTEAELEELEPRSWRTVKNGNSRQATAAKNWGLRGWKRQKPLRYRNLSGSRHVGTGRISFGFEGQPHTARFQILSSRLPARLPSGVIRGWEKMVRALGHRRGQAPHDRYFLLYDRSQVSENHPNRKSKWLVLVHSRDANLRKARATLTEVLSRSSPQLFKPFSYENPNCTHSPSFDHSCIH